MDLPLLVWPLTTSRSLSSLSFGLAPMGLWASFCSSSRFAGLLLGIGLARREMGPLRFRCRRLTGARGIMMARLEAVIAARGRGVFQGLQCSSQEVVGCCSAGNTKMFDAVRVD